MKKTAAKYKYHLITTFVCIKPVFTLSLLNCVLEVVLTIVRFTTIYLELSDSNDKLSLYCSINLLI